MKSLSLEQTSVWRILAYRSNYLWRLLATGLAFVVFAIGSLFIVALVLPFVVLTSQNRAHRIARTRGIIRHAFRLFLSVITLWGLIKIQTQGLETLKNLKGHLVICNHPSLLDVLIIVSRLENIQCIVKKELWWNPFLTGIVNAAGYIRNDMPPEALLACCKEQLAQGENILIFPEGTRTTPGEPVKLLRGLGNLALAAKADIQALAMDCNPVLLPKGRRWYKIPSRRAVFKLQVGPVFLSTNYQNDALRSIRVRALMRDIQQYYNDL